MAYFSNGTEGLDYQEQFCFRCEHYPDDETKDCPIWSAHFFHNSDRHTNEAVGSILDMLIPMVDHTFTDGLTLQVAGQCSFFTRKQLVIAFIPEEDVPLASDAETR